MEPASELEFPALVPRVCSSTSNLTFIFLLFVVVIPLGPHLGPSLPCWLSMAVRCRGFLEPEAHGPPCSFNSGTKARSDFIPLLHGGFVPTTLKRAKQLPCDAAQIRSHPRAGKLDVSRAWDSVYHSQSPLRGMKAHSWVLVGPSSGCSPYRPVAPFTSACTRCTGPLLPCLSGDCSPVHHRPLPCVCLGRDTQGDLSPRRNLAVSLGDRTWPWDPWCFP